MRCPQPTTALPDGDAAAAETPSAACDAPSHPAPVAYRLPPALLHKLHAAACAVLCGGTQELAPPQPHSLLLSAEHPRETESFLAGVFFSVAGFYGEERAGFYGEED